MHTNMIIRQTLRLGTTVQRMNPKRNATVFKRVYPPKRLPGKIFSTFSFSDSFTRIYMDIFWFLGYVQSARNFRLSVCAIIRKSRLHMYVLFDQKSFDSSFLVTPKNVNIEKCQNQRIEINKINLASAYRESNTG